MSENGHLTEPNLSGVFLLGSFFLAKRTSSGVMIGTAQTGFSVLNAISRINISRDIHIYVSSISFQEIMDIRFVSYNRSRSRGRPME